MRVSVQPLLPTGNYLNVRIGIEQDFPEDTNVETAVNTIWDSITAIHMKRYPHLYDSVGKPLYEAVSQQDECRGSKVVDVVYPSGEIIPLIEELEACTTYADIQSYRFTVKNADEQATYIRKLEELSPKNQ